jgi:transcriptional regulator GlxA family with amidase domain
MFRVILATGMPTIVVLSLEGMLDSSFAITLDTLRSAETFHARTHSHSSLEVLTAGYSESLATAAGLRLFPDLTFEQLESGAVTPDWVILPALGLSSEEAIAERLQRDDAQAAIRLFHALPEETTIATSCSSVFLLAATGLLDGRHVTTTWWLAHLFRRLYPAVRLDESRMLVRDGRYLTAGSTYSQLDLMLNVVAETHGAAVADLCARYLNIDERPSQARYMVRTHSEHLDVTVIAAERWIDQNLGGPIEIGTVAREVGVSPRTLARRITAATGLTPLQFIQRRRLLYATHMLETTSSSIDEVAAAVGYKDATPLRKLIKREFGVTPTALRAKSRRRE